MRLAPRFTVVLLSLSLLSGPVLRADTAPTAAATAQAIQTAQQDLEKRLLGKTVYLRSFYQEDRLEFDEKGKLKSNGSRGSFALSALQIQKVRFTKKTMEIEADRIGLHFFGALPDEGDAKTFEMLKVSKKPVEISIDRLVIEPEKKKKKKDKAGRKDEATPAGAQEDAAKNGPAPETSAASADTQTATVAAPGIAPDRTHDPLESYRQLSVALDTVFANSLDKSVIDTLPSCWQAYFAAKAGKPRAASTSVTAYRPGGDVIAPRLLTTIDPDSNDYAQRNGIAGMILLQTVVSPDGRPGPVTIMRPIGFGLDEKAVAAVEKSQFRPGSKDGRPVPVLVNLEVTFRIYSSMTRSRHGRPEEATPSPAPAPARPEPRGTQTVAAATVGE
jgi:TonB family protein